MDSDRSATIRRLNDEFRTEGVGGRIVFTSGIRDLGAAYMERTWGAVRDFRDFAAGDDPNEEHDFGALKIDDRDVFWKIDYYTPDLRHGSEDPTDPDQTVRVLTIMLAEEY